MPSLSRNASPHLDAVFPFALFGLHAHQHRERCERALDALGESDRLTALKLTAHLVASLVDLDPAAALDAAGRVGTMAKALDTPTARAYALTVHGLTDHSPDTVGNRVNEARLILESADRGDTPELAEVGHFLLLTALLEQGRMRALDIELSPHGDSITRFPALHRSRHAAWFRCLRAILDGRTAEAEQLANDILAAADDTNLAASRSVWAAQIGTIRWMQGRIFEMEPAFLAARHEQPQQQLWEVSLAWLWQLQGRDDAARALFHSFTDLDTIPRDRNYLVTATILAELAAAIGTTTQVELLRDALLPYANQAVPVGFGLAFWGTVARTLGILSIRLGRHDEARSLFRTAIDVCARNGAQAWLAESQLELADLEVRTDGDLGDAHALAQQAAATSRALGFPALLERAEKTLTLIPAQHRASTPPRQQTVSELPQRVHIRVLGTFDVTAHDGTKTRWTSRKARELLKMLISRRGAATPREALMHELWPDIHPDRLANRFSVALSTIRRTLDPARQQPTQHYVVTDGDTLHLNHKTVRIDIDDFFTHAKKGDIDSLRHATTLYTGDAFAEEPYAAWASASRNEAQTAFCAAAHRVAEHDNTAGDHLAASALYRRILDIEPFDDAAHDGLITALIELGAEGQASAMQLRREMLRNELAG